MSVIIQPEQLDSMSAGLFRDHLFVPSSTIFLAGEINQQMADQLAKGLHLLGFAGEPITIYLNSFGGSKTAGLGIFDLIRACPLAVKIIGYGAIVSTAVIVLQAGDERVLGANTEFMIHPGHSSTGEDLDENTARTAKACVQIRDRYYKILADQMGLSVREMNSKYGYNTWLSPKAAVKIGLADSIL